MEGEEDQDRYEQSIRILRPDNSSAPIMGDAQSLMSLLSDQAVYSLRLYVLVEDRDAAKKQTMRVSINQEMAALLQ
jgi:hypothetical protein